MTIKRKSCTSFLVGVLTLIAQPQGEAKERILNFPSNKSFGMLFTCEASNQARDRGFGRLGSPKAKIIGAQGHIQLDVSPGDEVVFEPNRKLYEHPDQLSQLSFAGIDKLRITFTAMDVREEKLCDNFFAYLAKKRGLLDIDAKNSDVSDRGIEALKDYKGIQRCDLTSTIVSAKSLRYMSNWPTLRYLFASSNDLKIDKSETIPSFPCLERLYLERAHVTNHYLSTISGCVALKELGLSNNVDLDDSCVQYLKALKHLEVLFIDGTSIHPSAISALQGLPLKKLLVSKSRLDAKTAQQLEKAFPGAYRETGGHSKHEDRDLNYIFSPLK